MKKLSLLLIVICGLVIAGCQPKADNEFAVFLLSQDVDTADISKIDIDTLALEGEPIFTSSDIISYDKHTHTIALSQSTYTHIQQIFPTPVKLNGIPFVVQVGAERIYTGAFWTPLSSISFDGVVIMQPFDTQGKTIQLSLGYPGPDAFTGSDPRADSQILDSLAQDGKLLEMQ